MRPFNYDLYAKSAEEALRRIRDATMLSGTDLRAIAQSELQTLRARYAHNGYVHMQPDQKKARRRHHP